MDQKNVSLVIEQGRTLRQWFRIRLSDGTIADLPDAGYTSAILQVRDTHRSSGGEVLMELTTDDGGIVLGLMDDGTGTMWSGYIYAPSAITKNLEPWGEAVYDLAVIHEGGSDVDTVARGDAYLVLEVSAP